jgi:hypothetical protein
MASWAMNGLSVPQQDQRREFFGAFYRYWLKEHPLSGKRQVRKYQLIARRLIEQIARRGPAEVSAAQQLIFTRVIAPTGATLGPDEFEGAYQRLRATMEQLIQRHGLVLDPADIPHPADEIMARSRQTRQKARVAEREEAGRRPIPRVRSMPTLAHGLAAAQVSPERPQRPAG